MDIAIKAKLFFSVMFIGSILYVGIRIADKIEGLQQGPICKSIACQTNFTTCNKCRK